VSAPDAVRFGAVSAAGMALCCSLTALATAGSLSATVGRAGGSIGLGVAAGLLVELPGAATDEPHRDHAA
jgi:hypothetical protein